MPEYECTTFDPYCLNDRPLRMDHLHIELPSVLNKRMVLGELDSTIVKRGTVNVELLEHYAYDTRTKRHISVRNSLKVRNLLPKILLIKNKSMTPQLLLVDFSWELNPQIDEPLNSS